MCATPPAARKTAATPSRSSGTICRSTSGSASPSTGNWPTTPELRDELLADSDNHLARETDTEIILHAISREFAGDRQPTLIEMLKNVCRKFDGAYSLVLLNALGDMLVARDPLGLRPLCYAFEDPLFAAASESVALLNLGFKPESIKSLLPGQAITIVDGRFEVQRFANSPRQAHCFFEWIYFANVASTMDGRSVYLSRKALGEELARLEDVPIDEDTIVVPVPDTSKAAADAMAYKLGVPSLEGLIRNRYTGRTFIEGVNSRKRKVEAKYTPLREVLEGKRVLLVEDSIVRSTTMKVLLERIRNFGRAREIHVRVACPPIVAPCFYGIDMSTINELFAPRFLQGRRADAGGAGGDGRHAGGGLACVTCRSIRSPGPSASTATSSARPASPGEYPTPCGQELYQIALENAAGDSTQRTYESPRTAVSGAEVVRRLSLRRRRG